MGEAGVFADGERVELLEGEIVEMMPIGPYHSGVVGRLMNFFARLGGDRWIVHSQNPVRLNKRSEPLPDLVLLRPEAGDYTGRHPQPSDVILLVEVSDSSLAYDRDEKLAAYARAGIPEYWLVNLVEGQVEVYRGPCATGYESRQDVTPGDKLSPQDFPDVQLDVGTLLRQSV